MFRDRTPVSMATYSSHRVIMGNTVFPLFFDCLSFDLFIPQVLKRGHACKHRRVRGLARSDH